MALSRGTELLPPVGLNGKEPFKVRRNPGIKLPLPGSTAHWEAWCNSQAVIQTWGSRHASCSMHEVHPDNVLSSFIPASHPEQRPTGPFYFTSPPLAMRKQGWPRLAEPQTGCCHDPVCCPCLPKSAPTAPVLAGRGKQGGDGKEGDMVDTRDGEEPPVHCWHENKGG